MHSLNKTEKIILWVMVAASALGFFDAFYLTIKHYANSNPVCSIVAGCEVVTTSVYSVVLGVPIALLGVLYYIAILGTSLILLSTPNKFLKTLLPYATVAGLAASAWFVYLQLFVIQAICIYCMGSATTSTILFVCGMLLLKKQK